MVKLMHIGEVQHHEASGRAYFTLKFKLGPFGAPVTRTVWGQPQEDGSTLWDRISPEEAKALKGADLSAFVSIEAAEIEPQTFLWGDTERTLTSRTVVRFADENLDQAVRRSGSTLRRPQEAHAEAAVHQEEQTRQAGVLRALTSFREDGASW